MPDWTKSMEQSFKYYIVDPGTWRDKSKLKNILSGSKIERDLSAETLGSATFNMSEPIDECYIRAYLITRQNGITERFPLGTFLVQTQKTQFDGTYAKTPVDAYTPLLELKENPPPLGYSIMKDSNVMEYAYRLTREQVRAPVIKVSTDEKLYSNFVANTDDTWLTFISDLITNAKYELGLDELSQVIYLPEQDVESLQPVWEFNDDDNSILYPDISTDRDMYGIPNVVEVSYSLSNVNFFARVVNDDPNSPVSTVNRGRQITYRVTNPEFAGEPTDEQIQLYAKNLLDKLSSIEYTVTFSHGYCPVRLGDCVRLNYKRANMYGVKAKITKQSIELKPGCPITETAVFTKNLWR